MIKVVLLTAALAPITSITLLATPVDVSFTGGAPQHYWGTGDSFGGEDLQYEDLIMPVNGGSAVDLSGANSIQVTWNAPAGYMYVVNPPPADITAIGPLTLAFTVQYGSPGQASSLGSVTAASIAMNLVYGSSPLGPNVSVYNSLPPDAAGLTIGAAGNIASGSSAFAFRSITVNATFSGTGAAGTVLQANDFGDTTAGYFGVLIGLPTIFASDNWRGPGDPGQLLTLEPIPGGSVPDQSSTLALAGFGLGGLMLFRRKLALS